MATEAIAAPTLDPPEAEPATKAKDAKGKDKKPAKGKKEEKGKDKQPQAPEGAPTIVAHPRAMRSIARAKGWAGLLGFFIAGYMALPTSTLAGAGLRALLAGVASYVVVWGAAVFIWRRLVMLELKGRQAQMLADLEKAAAARLGPGSQPGAADGR
jgi:hypothetical protein